LSYASNSRQSVEFVLLLQQQNIVKTFLDLFLLQLADAATFLRCRAD